MTRIFFQNFVTKIRDFLKANRGEVIKWAIIIVSAAIACLVIWYGIQALARARYSSKIKALEDQVLQLSAEAKAREQKAEEAKARAALLDQAINEEEANAAALASMARRAEVNLSNTRVALNELKDKYEKSRVPLDSVADTSYAGVCSELSRVGYPCQPPCELITK